MRLIALIVMFGILNIFIGFSDENLISQHQKDESEGSIETEEIVAKTKNPKTHRTLEEILYIVNKLIDSKFNNATCSKNQLDEFKEFIIKRLKKTNINQLNNSYELLIKNIEIASERFKKGNSRCNSSQMFAMHSEAFQGASFSLADIFKDLWPFS